MAGSAAENTLEDSLADHWCREGYIVERGIYDAEGVSKLRTLSENILEQWRI